MNASVPRRPHLVERAADVARAAITSHAPLDRAPLAPVEVIVQPAESVVPPALPPARPAASAPGLETFAPVSHVLLRGAGLAGASDPGREEIAVIREQVLRTVEATGAAEGREGRLVMITSAHNGEGKSFVALNLGASIADGARRPAILVDIEGGAGSLTTRLGLEGTPGLEQLRDKGDIEGFLRHTEIPGLLVLPRGLVDPSNVQGSAVASALLHLAGRLPDHIILLDTPACMERSIASVLAAAAGQVVLVVEAERTKRVEVEAALDILDACPTLQLLLNRSALRVSDRFRGRAARAGDAAIGANKA
jgi:receptor protein-tyrosine kinase